MKPPRHGETCGAKLCLQRPVPWNDAGSEDTRKERWLGVRCNVWRLIFCQILGEFLICVVQWHCRKNFLGEFCWLYISVGKMASSKWFHIVAIASDIKKTSTDRLKPQKLGIIFYVDDYPVTLYLCICVGIFEYHSPHVVLFLLIFDPHFWQEKSSGAEKDVSHLSFGLPKAPVHPKREGRSNVVWWEGCTVTCRSWRWQEWFQVTRKPDRLVVVHWFLTSFAKDGRQSNTLYYISCSDKRNWIWNLKVPLQCMFPFNLLSLEDAVWGVQVQYPISTTIAEKLEALGRRSGKRSKDYFTKDLTQYKFWTLDGWVDGSQIRPKQPPKRFSKSLCPCVNNVG